MTLPRGVRLVRGYVQVRIVVKGRYYHKNFGADCPLAREYATKHMLEKRHEVRLGKFGIVPEAPAIRFEVAREVFYRLHYEKYRDVETDAPRTEGSKCTARGLLAVLGRFFDKYELQALTVKALKQYQDRRLHKDKVTPATFNREIGILAALFNQYKAWIAEELIPPVKLPDENPCDYIPTMRSNKRDRVPDTWELAAAYEWCQKNDSSLWQAIENALLTALRKGDLVGLDGSLTVKGIQLKTGEKFELPIRLEWPTNVKNIDKRWDALRLAMGWLKRQAKHTTWHDLRHWAPTLLGESGFSIKIIQRYLGHKREETSERYTNTRQKALVPAVDVVKKELARIKEESRNGNKNRDTGHPK